jgi:biotin carboxyl carrier protein
VVALRRGPPRLPARARAAAADSARRARSAFLDIRVEEDLSIAFPERFADETRAAELARALAPPPPAAFDEIVTPMGGTFYAREAPHLPALIEEGQHFDAGQALFVIEVMKMFNVTALSAPCSRT